MVRSARIGYMAAACSMALMTAMGSVAQAETLTEALSMAYDSSPTVLVARSAARQRDEAYWRTRTGEVAPASINLTIAQNATFDGRDNTSITAPATFSQLSINQPINTQGELARTLSAAEITLLQGRETLRQAESNLLRDVINAYVAVRRETAALAIAEEGLATAAQGLAQQEAQYSVGLVARTNVETNRVAVAQQRSALENSRNTLAQTRANYAVLVGKDPENLQDLPALPNVPATYEEALRIAQTQSNTIRNALYTHRQSEITLANARAVNRPRAAVSAGYTIAGGEIRSNAGNDILNRDSANFGFSVSMPLVTFGLNSSTLRSALEARAQADLNLTQTRRQLVQQVQTAWNTLQNNRSTIINSEAQLASQRLATDGIREEFNQGQRTNLDLLNQENSLRSAQQNVNNARASEYTAAVALLQLIGLLEPRYLIPNAELYDPLAYFNQIEGKFFRPPYEPVLNFIDSIAAPKVPDVAAENTLPAADLRTVAPLTTPSATLPAVVLPPAAPLPAQIVLTPTQLAPLPGGQLPAAQGPIGGALGGAPGAGGFGGGAGGGAGGFGGGGGGFGGGGGGF